jgi:hypothetical protein
MKQSFRWGVFSPEFGKKLAKPNVISPLILKHSAKNRSAVAALIGKIATSSPAARFKDSCAALGPAANLTLEHIGLILSQIAQSSKGGAFLHKASWQEADFRPAF